MPAQIYPSKPGTYNVFRGKHLILSECPSNFLVPRGNKDKGDLIVRYIKQLCGLSKSPAITDSVITQFNEYYKIGPDIYILVNRETHLKGE